MSQPSDRPAPRFGPRPAHEDAVQDAIYRRIAQESGDALNTAIAELELLIEDRQYCDWLVSGLRGSKDTRDYWYDRSVEVESEMLDLRSALAERDMEIERLRAADVTLSEEGVAAAWAVVDKHHGAAYQVPMIELLYAYLDAARAASRDEERDHA